MASLALDLNDLRKLADNPARAYKQTCAEGTANVRRVRELVEQRWMELPDDVQSELLELAQRIREAPNKLGFGERVSAVMQLGWKFVFEPHRGVSEAFTFAVEIARFMAAIDIQARDQERRQRWLFETAPADHDVCSEADLDKSPAYSFEEIRARVAGQH